MTRDDGNEIFRRSPVKRLGFTRQDDHGNWSNKRAKVAVFGAGISGLTVAHELAERGFEVHVFEQRVLELEAGGLAGSQLHRSERARFLFHDLYGEELAREGISEVPPVLLPGEHGFRFFPSFYQHVIDTMRRIPIWERPSVNEAFPDLDDVLREYPIAAFGGNRRATIEFFRPPTNVADNLVPTHKTGLVLDDGFRVLVYDRRSPRSMLMSFSYFLMWLAGLGHQTRDLLLAGMRLLQYGLSCRERRLAEYQKMSFWEYMQLDRTSPRFQRHMSGFIRVLIAMDARRADARVVLNFLLRLMLDHGEAGAQTDRVLNGPTTERWIIPWINHLRFRLGVRFYWGHRLERLHAQAGRVTGADLRIFGEPPPPASEMSVSIDTNLDSDGYQYFVTALELPAITAVLKASPSLEAEDAAEVAALPQPCFPQENPDPPLGALRDLALPYANPPMSGIQFYLSDSCEFIPGHLNFLDSPWGLTMVVQTQFWGQEFVSRYGHGLIRSILSVDLTDFDAPGLYGRSLNDILSDPSLDHPTKSDLVAKDVWKQIAKGLRNWELELPEPREFKLALPGAEVDFPIPLPYVDHHLDSKLAGTCSCRAAFDDDPSSIQLAKAAAQQLLSQGAVRPSDYVPYFVSPPDTWHKRPGPLPRYTRNEDGYRIRLGHLLVAGIYTQTFTGQNTMEAANESGRHVANAILHDVERRYVAKEPGRLKGFRYEKCTIWPLEESEPGDSVLMKQLDHRLWALGDPHMMEILGVDQMLDYFLSTHNVENKVSSPEEFHRTYEDLFWWLTAFGKFSPF